MTGGGRGIGRGITMALADRGFALVINYRTDEQAATARAAKLSSVGRRSAIAIRADVADLEQGRRLLDETIRSSWPRRLLGQ